MELGGSLGAFGEFMDVGGVLKGPSGGHWRSPRGSLGVFGGSFSPRGSSGRARECPKTRQVFPERLGGSWQLLGWFWWGLTWEVEYAHWPGGLRWRAERHSKGRP